MRNCLSAVTTAVSAAYSKMPSDFGGLHPNGSQLNISMIFTKFQWKLQNWPLSILKSFMDHIGEVLWIFWSIGFLQRGVVKAMFLQGYMYMNWKQRSGYYNIILPFEDTLTCAQRNEYIPGLSREYIWIFSLTLSDRLFLVTNNIHVPCSMFLITLFLFSRDLIFYCISKGSWI